MTGLHGANRDQRIDLPNPAEPPGSGAGPGPDRADGNTTPDAAEGEISMRHSSPDRSRSPRFSTSAKIRQVRVFGSISLSTKVILPSKTSRSIGRSRPPARA